MLIKTLFLFIGVSYFFSYNLKAQNTNLSLKINPIYNQRSLVLNDTINLNQDSLNFKITTLKFYISKIQLYLNEKLVYNELNSFHLVDAMFDDSKKISLSIPKSTNFNQLKFSLGLDSLCNVSGAMGGDLDPTKGMYWTWQNGYINFKMEGKWRNQTGFEYHLGGYQQPYNCLQTIIFPVNQTNHINLSLNLNEVFKNLDSIYGSTILSPSFQSVGLSKKIANAFILE